MANKNKAWIKKQFFIHLIGWFVFIVYEVSFVKMIRWDESHSNPVNDYVLPYLLNIGLFYFHAFVTIRFGLGSSLNKIGLFILLILFELCIYLLLMGLNEWLQSDNKEGSYIPFYRTRLDLIRQLWRALYFLIFSTAFWLIFMSFKKVELLKGVETMALKRQQEKKELELKLITTQNAFLQSQINPHLLFNTLNFIYSEVQQVSPKASEAIRILSDMMRYSLAEVREDGKTLLEKEIEQIHNLITINQQRFSNKLALKMTIEGEYSDIRIMPLLLLPFVENIFKYAELSNADDPARITASLKNSILYFETSNKKNSAIRIYSSGIGINNVRTRLEAYYLSQFELNITESSTNFLVSLTLKL